MIQATRTSHVVTIDRFEVHAYNVPTEVPESDSTLEWDHTPIVVVHVYGGRQWGVGYTYGSRAAGMIINEQLAPVLLGRDAMAIGGAWEAMKRALRSAGQPGLGAAAMSAVDCALWDLKARLLDQPLATLLGPVRSHVDVYGSGGFLSYDEKMLAEQLTAWVAGGIPRVKIKVGRGPEDDLHRVTVARRTIGAGPQLFVDASGGYSRKVALAMAGHFAERFNVTWFEEPRPSDDLEGLHMLRELGPPGMDIAAGEYGYKLPYYRHMLEVGAVDCVQADLTRCGGITGFLKVAALCEAFLLPLSAHGAPTAHVHAACATRPLRHIEYFHDHVRVEQMLFNGVCLPDNGAISPDWTTPGMGLELKRADAERFAA